MNETTVRFASSCATGLPSSLTWALLALLSISPLPGRADPLEMEGSSVSSLIDLTNSPGLPPEILKNGNPEEAFKRLLAESKGGKDEAQSVVWYHKAAEQGNADAQFNLSIHYFKGRGVDTNFQEAVKWASLSANQGYAPAENAIGFACDRGTGVPQDLVEACKWYQLAINQGNASARANMRNLQPWLTTEQIADGQARAGAFIPKGLATQSNK